MSIAVRAREAANTFEEWKDSASDSSGLQVEEIENQMFRFNLWTFNNYVFESPRASMDWRLRNAPLLLSTMEDLLEDLNAGLLYRIKALHDSTEDGIGRPKSESVEAILDQLFRFSRAVRRSGILHRLVKIANHIEYDADGVNLTATFQAGISRLVEHYLRGCSASEELRDRLVETICLRRRNFSYLKAQRESRSSKKPTKIPVQAASRARSTLTSSFSITMPVSTTARETKHVTLDPILELGRSVMTATTAQINSVPIHHSIQSSVGTDQQQRNTDPDGLELPQPPEIPFGLKEWECSYCLIVCSVKEFSPENWVKHILADIMPYICLLDSCHSSNTLFRSKKDWLYHMEKEHTAQSWTCLDSTHETKLSFQAQDKFEQHMRDEHEGQFEETDLEDLVEACFESSITSVTFTKCPFCPEDSNMDTIPQDWTQHMAQHLLYFSRLSFDGYLEDEDQQSDVSKSIGSSDVSGPQVLSGTIADGLREMSLDSYSENEIYPEEERKKSLAAQRRQEEEEAFLGIPAMDPGPYEASRDPIEEDEGFKLDISSSVSEASISSIIPEVPPEIIPEIPNFSHTERMMKTDELWGIGSHFEKNLNDEDLMITPMASQTPPDTEGETWEFFIRHQNFNQYDPSNDPILRSFRKNLGTPEEKRSDEINQSLELSGFPDSDINPRIEGKPNEGEKNPLHSALSVSSGLNQPVLLSTGPDSDQKEAPPSVSHFCTTFLERWAPLFVADLPSSTSKGSPRQLMSEMERFNRWTTSIGVHRPGPLSLDSRLETLPDIKRRINSHLLDLEGAMRTLVPQLTSKGVSETFDEPDYPFSWVMEENDHSAQQVIESEYDRLKATIDALFQIQDQDLEPLASPESFETEHVKKKYPNASAEITTRLGLANAQRRRGLQDRRRQNLMLDRGLDQIFESRMDDASSHLAETVRPTPGDVANAMGDDLQGCLPPPPIPIAPSDSGQETIFECPYCYSMISIKSLKDWVSHIFDDLLPYICVYPKCSVPRQLFHSRREWFLHIRSQHFRKESADFPQNCPLCLSNIISGNFEEHVGRHLEELALFALPVPEDDEYETESSSSEAKLLHDVLSETHENHGDGEAQVDKATQFNADANQPTTRDASTNTPSRRRTLAPGGPHSGTDEARTEIIYIRRKLRKHPQYIGNLHALLFDAGEIEDGIISIGDLRAAAAVRLRKSNPAGIYMLHNGKALSWDFISCREAGLEHKSEVLCDGLTEDSTVQSQISNPGITIDLYQPRARNKIEQDVGKAEHQSVPSFAQGGIPKIPDLSSMPTSLEKITACKSYFQQELVPRCLQLIDDFPSSATAEYHFDNKLMSVLDISLKLLEMMNEIDHGSDMQSIAAYQTLRSQVKRVSEQLIGARNH